ncbi:hypothetical protein [Candidatus Venteria ishoeyi]|uniref:Uncharacterized protein n=1 Tax=Candidatus Venteria ishoeyi TaxID=1899563 RepID=A0A1H6FD56_9GAMM|nr:hypothetical protein [Candidatus Venteria ishoeyi]SEH07096.1 Uncharacterised protein [Candidatus Venteria ishoeyi]
MPKRQPKKYFGALPPQYHFVLNPFPDVRCSTCPNCGTKTGQRKLPLLIHIDPDTLIAINYTNRYCKRCDLLIGHRFDIERLLAETFREGKPEIIGNDYLIFATLEKKTWRESMQQPKSPAELSEKASDFKSYQELQMSMGGWFHKDQEPPARKPPPSTEWVSKADK